MRRRAAILTAGVALALAGCGSPPSGTPDPTPTAPSPAAVALPGDAVLALVAVAEAPNGALADVAIVVHASLPWSVPDAADAVAATVDWCAGEVDEAVISGRGFSFTAVDVSLTPRGDDWPADLPLAVLPTPNPEVGSVVVAGAGLRQVDASFDDALGDAVPHCLQPALLDGPGTATLWLGIPGDIAGVSDELASFTAWTAHDFGLSAELPGDLGASEVRFLGCLTEVTPLGEEVGAPTASWREVLGPDRCAAGGAPAG